ncbi:MAG: C39 family peptidase [Parasphingorhabdus sp.]|uniref:C39 family peptidase n=1 Tax=Parasphingorhabdus sp. TaxID=2709688 RepID=UPI003002DF3B
MNPRSLTSRGLLPAVPSFKKGLKDGMLALTGAALSLALFWSPAANAEVRLGREALGGDYAVGVMTYWDIPFRSVVRQRYDFSCGSAAVATLLTYHYDLPTAERTPFKAMWDLGDKEAIKKVGFSMLDMRSYLQSIGYRAEGFKLEPGQLAQVKRPVIVLLDLNGFKHFVVVKGQTKDQVLVGDSVLGIKKYSTKDFYKYWNGIVLAIVDGPIQKLPTYNLAGDWSPWAPAPTDQVSATASIGDLTTHLPPLYQLTPEFLLDVRVGTVR